MVERFRELDQQRLCPAVGMWLMHHHDAAIREPQSRGGNHGRNLVRMMRVVVYDINPGAGALVLETASNAGKGLDRMKCVGCRESYGVHGCNSSDRVARIVFS